MKRTIHRPIHQTRASAAGRSILSALLIVYSLIAVYLIGNALLSAFKTKQDLIHNTFGWPRQFVLDNLRIVLIEDGFFRNMLNSALLVSMGTALLIATSSTVSYGLTMYTFRGRGFLGTYFTIGLMFPIQLGILPLFILMKWLGLVNSLFGLALIYASSMSFSVVVFSRFFKGFERSLLEAGRIDGASDLQSFLYLVIPVMRPVVFTVALLNFIMIWNDFFLPLVFLTKSNRHTLTLGIYSYTANFLSNWNKVFAGVAVALVPIILIYFFFSEKIVEGLTTGAVKG